MANNRNVMGNEEEIILFQDTPNFIIYIWVNGMPASHAFTLLINNPTKYTYDSLKKEIAFQRNLKEDILSKIKLYNIKGMEIDDTDVSSLNYGDLLYLSYNGQKFSEKNYEYEFNIIGNIKKGGFSEIFLAKHNLTNKLYAIKKTNLSEFGLDSLYIVSREAMFLESLKHKNIIKIYNSYLSKGNLYIIMDYAKGGELTNVVKENGLDENMCKFYFKQIYSAIQFMHSKNIVHRDIKLNNILFLDEDKKNIVLIDFGISGCSNGNNSDVIKAGTINYMPPEMCDKNKFDTSDKIDIWALGIILYILFTGNFPFDGKNNTQIMEKIVKQPLIFPKKKKISETLYILLKSLLEKNPINRININSPLFNDWFDDEELKPHKFQKGRCLSLFNKILYGNLNNLNNSSGNKNILTVSTDVKRKKYINNNIQIIQKNQVNENNKNIEINKLNYLSPNKIKDKINLKLKIKNEQNKNEKLVLPRIIINNINKEGNNKRGSIIKKNVYKK